jgi:hypothetical protein
MKTKILKSTAILLVLVGVFSSCKKQTSSMDGVWECKPAPKEIIRLTIDEQKGCMYVTTVPQNIEKPYLFHNGDIIKYTMQNDTIVFLEIYTMQNDTIICGENSGVKYIRTIHSPNRMTLEYNGVAIANAIGTYLFSRKNN